MLKITIECEGTGAELREELISLLIGENEAALRITNPGKLPQSVISEAVEKGVQISNAIQEEIAAPVVEKPKRQSKKATQTETLVEEVKPEEAPAEETPAQDESPFEQAPEEILAPVEEKAAPTVTLEQLTQKALDLNREKKKPQVVAILEEFDALSFSPKGSDKPLKAEHYAAVWEKLNQL